jgi:hypothetical protein
MKNLKDFIDENFNEFINLGNSEVCEFKDLTGFDDEFINYLKLYYRFDYRGICVYLADNEIWVENMLS